MAIAAAMVHPGAMEAEGIAARVDALDWAGLTTRLDASGCAATPAFLPPEACAALAALWDEPARFRSEVTMARHGYGSGRYRYFGDPLPAAVAALRSAFYRALAPLAAEWERRLGRAGELPPDHAGYLRLCRAAGQTRPTPLLLRYRPGDYNRLHRDLYGAIAFPLQAVIQLGRSGPDFTGGELVVVEQTPRMQSRAEVLPLAQGAAAIFAVNERPVPGARGWRRAAMRHGVSVVRSGERLTLGIILHDAR